MNTTATQSLSRASAINDDAQFDTPANPVTIIM